MQFKGVYIILIVIILFGLILRFINIESNPPSLYGDELTIVYDSYSILMTGHDQVGEFLPLVFQLGAGRLPGYVYGSIPFVAVFGPGAMGVRFLSLISGIGIILLMFFLVNKMFNKKIALIVSGLVAISPWDLSLSRGGFEAHFALFLTLLGLNCFVYFRKNCWLILVGVVSFVLASQTYPTYKLTLALFFPLIIWFLRHDFPLMRKNMVIFVISLLILIFGSFLVVYQAVNTSSETRFQSINIFSQEDLRQSIIQSNNYQRTISETPQRLKSLFYNRMVSYMENLGVNYFESLSWNFLFVKGDGSPRHNMSGVGEFYIIESVFILMGLFYLWSLKRETVAFLVIWILIAPIPTAILGDPQALRNSLMFPPLEVLSALGIYYLFTLTSRKKSVLGIVFLFFAIYSIQLIFMLNKFYFLSPYEFSKFWNYSAKLASQMAIDEREKYKYIILSDHIDGMEFAYPVYARTDPSLVISQNKNRSVLNNTMFKKFGNVYIGYIPDSDILRFTSTLDGSVLYIGTPDQIKYLKDYSTFNGLDGTTAIASMKKL